jgi:rhamnogalacturonyl hydrolase YesR
MCRRIPRGRLTRTASVILAAALLAPACSKPRESRLPPAEASPRTPASFGQVTLKGELGARFATATANLLSRQDRYSIDSYKSNASATPGAALWYDWPGDQLGRMFSVMHVAEGYGWTPAKSLRASVADAILPCQTRLGNFGLETPYDNKDARIISGNAFALRGLMDAYEDSGDPRYLDAARKLARYFEAAFDTWKDNGKGMLHEFYGHCLDGLVRLYELGGDRWALDLAKKAAVRAGRTGHTHHSLSMYRGVIDLARATGDRSLLDRAEDYLEWCRENRIVSGGLPESMPRSEQDEGCALADFVAVNLMMFQATGRDAYLDDAEHTLVNHLFMNQFHTGGFGHRRYAADVIGGKQWQGWAGKFGSENPGCCSMWGEWALGQLGRYIVTRSEGALEVNLYPSAAVDLPELGARIEIESDFPRMSKALLTVHCDKPLESALRLRVPDWARGTALKLNGRNAVGAARTGDGRIVLDRKWRSGDRVEIAFAGSLRLVSWPDSGAAAAAVFDGPLCLAISSAYADVDAFSNILVASDGSLDLSPDGRPQASDGKGAVVTSFRPIAADWLSPDVMNPNRLRVLFTKQIRPLGR